MNDLATALYSKIAGGTAVTAQLAGTTAVYDTVIPQSATYPCVVFQQQAWGVETLDPQRREDAWITIKAVGTVSYRQAGSIDNSLDLLLDGGSLSVTGHNVLWCKRQSQIRYSEPRAGGGYYYHQGGIYRIRLS
jgi:hypothetical protein